MVKIRFGPGYEQMYRDLVQDDQEFKDYIADLVNLFKRNPDDTRLDNHTLTKKMAGKWAFSITDDIRIVYEWLGKTTVRFLAIGGHKKAYKRKSE